MWLGLPFRGLQYSKPGYNSLVILSQSQPHFLSAHSWVECRRERRQTRAKGTFKLGCVSTKLKVLRFGPFPSPHATHSSSSSCQAQFLGSVSIAMCTFWAAFACSLVCLFVETGFLCTALAVLEIAPQTRLTSNSQRSTCLCLPSAGIKGLIFKDITLLEYTLWS